MFPVFGIQILTVFLFVTGIQEPALQRATGQAFRTGEGCARQKLRKRTSVNGRTAKQTGEKSLSGILIFINAPICSSNDFILSFNSNQF